MRALVVVLFSLTCSAALAQDAGRSAEDWLDDAQAAEDRADPGAALQAWRHLLEAAPGSRLGGRARARIGWIEERSEGDYAPLGALMTFLSRAPEDRDADVVSAFAAVADAMPEGRVRPEARVAVAGEWARLGEADRAHAAWQAALDDPGLPPSQRMLVQESMARARQDGGDLAGAIGELEAADLGTLTLHRTMERELRARTWVPIAYAIFGAFVLAVLALVARSGRAAEVVRSLRDAPLRPVLALLIGAGPFAIVSWWGDDSVDAFRAFAPFSVAIVALSFVAGEASEVRSVRLTIGALAILAALATAYASVALYGEALPFA